MNKRFTLALVSAALMAYTADAQGVKFGKRYMKLRMEQRLQAAAKKAATKAAKETQALAASAGNALDEYEERDGNRIFRYVYAYDKDMMRSSETVYIREKENGAWGTERLYTVGRYTYEYDTQGRLAAKTVTYDGNDWFDTYRVMVTYGDGITEYDKYEYHDGTYRRVESWSYYDNGVLASYTDLSHYDERTSTFDANGVSTGYTSGYNKITFGGELNNQAVTYYSGEDWDSETGRYTSWKQTGQETYKYDPTNGRLVEYTVAREHYDSKKYTYTYDALGRLSAIREYSEAGDDHAEMMPGGDINGDGVIDENDFPPYIAVQAATADVEEWELDNEETYTYLNDEVYGVGNSWHDVFGMDGPLTRIDVIDEDGERLETIFTRDADGKLTGITFPGQVTDSYYTSTDKATIDDNGQILKIEEEYSYKSGSWEDDPNYNGEDRSDYSYLATEYTWENGQAVKAVMTDKYEYSSPDGDYSYESQTTTRYAYDDGKVTAWVYEGDSQTPATRTIIEEDGANRKVHYRKYGDSYNDDEYIVSTVQTEDLAFVRPNLKADVDGMTADSTIVVSVAGRVVCAYEDEDGSDPGFGFFQPEYDNTSYYVNTASGSTYFTVEHDGNETVCNDILGRPVYILTDGRLTKEYKYYYTLNSPTGPDQPITQMAAAYAANIPEGVAYDEITYVYDSDGRLAGRTEVSVDENGTRTEEIILEYKYDEASGIASAEANAPVGVTIDGRRIGLTGNGAFSVCTIGGQVIASGVTSYTFNSPGIYIVNANGVTTKIAVK